MSLWSRKVVSSNGVFKLHSVKRITNFNLIQLGYRQTTKLCLLLVISKVAYSGLYNKYTGQDIFQK